MRNLKGLFSAALLAGASLFAQELVKNGGFDLKEGTFPEGWKVNAKGESVWEHIDYDGVSNASAICVRAKTKGALLGTVVQDVACSKNTQYALSAYMKSDGSVPNVSVTSKDGKVLAEVKSDSLEWSKKSAAFNSGDADVLHVIVAGGAMRADGYAAVDNVSLKEAAGNKEAAESEQVKAAGKNIALGKPYTFSSKPNYNLCSDDGDATQLTDGIYTKGYFWTQKSTVGWKEGNGFQHVTIDLGKVSPIGGFSLNTAYALSATVHPLSHASTSMSARTTRNGTP